MSKDNKDDLVTRKGMDAHEGITDARQRSHGAMQVSSGESRTAKWTDSTGKTITMTFVDGAGPYVSVQKPLDNPSGAEEYCGIGLAVTKADGTPFDSLKRTDETGAVVPYPVVVSNNSGNWKKTKVKYLRGGQRLWSSPNGKERYSCFAGSSWQHMGFIVTTGVAYSEPTVTYKTKWTPTSGSRITGNEGRYAFKGNESAAFKAATNHIPPCVSKTSSGTFMRDVVYTGGNLVVKSSKKLNKPKLTAQTAPAFDGTNTISETSTTITNPVAGYSLWWQSFVWSPTGNEGCAVLYNFGDYGEKLLVVDASTPTPTVTSAPGVADYAGSTISYTGTVSKYSDATPELGTGWLWPNADANVSPYDPAYRLPIQVPMAGLTAGMPGNPNGTITTASTFSSTVTYPERKYVNRVVYKKDGTRVVELAFDYSNSSASISTTQVQQGSAEYSADSAPAPVTHWSHFVTTKKQYTITYTTTATSSSSSGTGVYLFGGDTKFHTQKQTLNVTESVVGTFVYNEITTSYISRTVVVTPTGTLTREWRDIISVDVDTKSVVYLEYLATATLSGAKTFTDADASSYLLNSSSTYRNCNSLASISGTSVRLTVEIDGVVKFQETVPSDNFTTSYVGRQPSVLSPTGVFNPVWSTVDTQKTASYDYEWGTTTSGSWWPYYTPVTLTGTHYYYGETATVSGTSQYSVLAGLQLNNYDTSTVTGIPSSFITGRVAKDPKSGAIAVYVRLKGASSGLIDKGWLFFIDKTSCKTASQVLGVSSDDVRIWESAYANSMVSI